MNIFALDNDPKKAARYHCDKHVVKMVIESAQMLSTAHRLLDGELTIEKVTYASGRKGTRKTWTIPNDPIGRDDILYRVAHPHHPSTKWTCESAENYRWHYQLFVSLCEEYTHRYGKHHMSDTKLRDILAILPQNINYAAKRRSPFALAMKSEPQCIDQSDPIGSYRSFYKTKQDKFTMAWTNRRTPKWFNAVT